MSIKVSDRYLQSIKKETETIAVNHNSSKFFEKNIKKIKKRLDTYAKKDVYSSMNKRYNITKIDVRDTIDVMSNQQTIKNVKGDNKMDLLTNLMDTEGGINLNTVNDTSKLIVKPAGKYFEMLSQNHVNLSPVYQRPYTYNDEDTNTWGNRWQKKLIGDFLKGEFIQPIHLLENTNTELMGSYLYWIIDGGHRTRTLYNFFIGNLLNIGYLNVWFCYWYFG